MSNLTICNAQRKSQRIAVTKIFNDRKNFANYDSAKRSQIKMKIENLVSSLEDLNEKILDLKFADEETVDQSKLDAEIAENETYSEKLLEIQSSFSTEFVPIDNS